MPTLKLRPWQERVLAELPSDLPSDAVIAIRAPTGSGKTILSLLIADRLGPDVVLAIVRTRSEMVRFWEDTHKIGYPYKPLAFFAKSQHCLRLREREKGRGKGGSEGEEEREEEVRLRCDNCDYYNSLYEVGANGVISLKGDLDALLGAYSSVNPGLGYEEYRASILEELKWLLRSGLGKLCTYDHLRTIAKESVRRRLPVLLIGTYPHVFGYPSILFENTLVPRARPVVIIDEAHNLDTLDFLEKSVSTRRLDKLVDACTKYCEKEPGLRACSRLNDILKTIEGVRERLVEVVGSYDAERALKHPTREHLEELVNLLRGVRDLVEPFVEFEDGRAGDEPVQRRVVGAFVDTVDFMTGLFNYKTGRGVGIDSFLDYDPSAWNFYVTRVGKNARLVAKPFAVKPIIQYARTRFKGPWIIMSGTLPPKWYIEKVWGLSVAWYVNLTDEVRIGKKSVVIRGRGGLTSVFRRRNEEMFMRYAKEVRRIVMNNGSGVFLVVYPSYTMMRGVTKYLADLPVPQRREGDVKHLPDLVRDALALQKLVIHAVSGGRFTEGIELVRHLENGGVESLIKHVILAGVPYPNVKDDFVQDRVAASGLDRKKWFNVHGWMNTTQAIGRAFRSEGDEATVWLLDNRYYKLAKKWGITKGAVWVRYE